MVGLAAVARRRAPGSAWRGGGLRGVENEQDRPRALRGGGGGGGEGGGGGRCEHRCGRPLSHSVHRANLSPFALLQVVFRGGSLGCLGLDGEAGTASLPDERRSGDVRRIALLDRERREKTTKWAEALKNVSGGVGDEAERCVGLCVIRLEYLWKAKPRTLLVLFR